MNQGVGRWYFAIASALLLALTLIGFSDNLVTDVGQPSNFDPKFIVHGLFCLAWMMVLTAQALLIRRGAVRLHRRFGQAAFLIAVGVVLSTLYVFWAVWKGWAALDTESQANRLLLPSYALAIWLAWRNRWRPEWHKRFVLVGTLYMLGPIIARTYDPLLVPFMGGLPKAQVDFLFYPYFYLLWTAFFVSLAIHDLRVPKRLHPVTIGGGLWFGAVWGIVAVV